MVLRRTFGPNMVAVTGRQGDVQNESHHFYSPPSIIRVITSRRMRLVHHVARIWRLDIHIKFWLENLKGRDHLKGKR
jgi:hypothetical protein